MEWNYDLEIKKMLIPKPDIRILTRKIILSNGREALACFALMNVQGVLEVKFLGTKLIEKEPVLLLENLKSVVFGETPICTIYETFSPYFSLDFLMNQLARAPSFK